jgi:hypothetical protein
MNYMEELITLHRYEVESGTEHQSIKVFFNWHGEDNTPIVVKVVDRIFRTVGIFQNMTVSKGVEYWASFFATPHAAKATLDTRMFCQNSTGWVLEFWKDDQVRKFDLNFCFTEFNRRSFWNKYDHSRKNFWVLGDSNVAYTLSGHDSEFFTEKVVINPISHHELSLNRFCNSDWQSFLRTIPFYEGDVLALMLGEIDLRTAVFRNAENKHMPIEVQLSKLLMKAQAVIEEIRKIYPKLKVGVIAPPPPLRDGTVRDQEWKLLLGTEPERMALRELFDKFFQKTDVDFYWDCYDSYRDSEGFMKRELQLDEDHHINNGSFFLESLKQNISNYAI